jgi:hypothetical protein
MSSDLRTKLASEVSVTSARDLVPHFARGGLLMLAPQLDLLDCAVAIARDERLGIEGWLSAGVLWRATDQDGRRLVAEPDARYQFVIVQPWVLAQALAPPA